MIVLQVFLVGAALLVALFYFGFGATRLLVPPAFRAFFFLLSPFTGMALVVVWDYGALALNWNLTVATWALAAVATAMNGVALSQWWREREAATAPTMRPRVGLPRAQWIVLGLGFLAFMAAVAPLLRYGYVSVIGENWDYEFYLPLADLLKTMPTAALASAPPNPLLATILSRHILPLPMGFSYLQGTLDVLTGQQALDTFAILLGVLHGLGVVAGFVFMRQTLRMKARWALVASALLAFNGLLLWFTYWNFGLHLAALALLPVTLMFGVYALRAPLATWGDAARALGTAGLFLGALNVTYHPALVAVLLPLGAIGLYELVTSRARLQVVGRGAALIGLTMLLSLPTLWHIPDFVREYYGRAPLAIGLREYVPLSDGYGFSLRILELAVGHTIPTLWLYALVAQGWSIAAPVLTVVAVGLSLYALWRLRTDTERRAVWYLIVGASVFYVSLLRLPFLRPYPYGFLKSLSLVMYILIPLAVQGGAFTFSNLDFRFSNGTVQSARWGRFVLGAMGVVVAAVVGVTFLLAVEQYFKPQPPFFTADALSLRQAAEKLPAGATVLLTDRAEVQGIPMGLAAYALLGHALYGDVKTGYGSADNEARGTVYDYALLARGEDASGRGYASQPLWENNTFALYPRAGEPLVQQTVNQKFDGTGPIALTLDDNGVVKQGTTPDSTPMARALTVGLVTFEPQTVTLRVGDASRTMALEPGLQLVTLDPVNLPATLTVTPQEGGSTLWLPYIQLRDAGGGAGGVKRSEALVIQCAKTGLTLDVRCAVANPQQRQLTWKWVVRGTLAGEHAERVIASAQADGAPQGHVEFQVGTQGNLQGIQFDGTAPIGVTTEALPDGKLRASVEVSEGNTLLARFDIIPALNIKGGEIAGKTLPNLPPVIVQPQ